MAGLVICRGEPCIKGRGGGHGRLGVPRVSHGGPKGLCCSQLFPSVWTPWAPTSPRSTWYLELIKAEGEVEDLGELLGQGLLPLEVLGWGIRGAGEGLQQAPQGVLWGQSTTGPRPAPVHLPGPG